VANLTPSAGDKLELITCDGEILPFPEPKNLQISGFFRPAMPIAKFLPAFSQLGGTHHSALCYDVPSSFWEDLALFLNIPHHQL
jgi:hypothetical protein